MRRCSICSEVHKYKMQVCTTCRTKVVALRRALQGDGVVNVQFLNKLADSDYTPYWYHDTKPKMCIWCMKNKPYMYNDAHCRACKDAGWKAYVV